MTVLLYKNGLTDAEKPEKASESISSLYEVVEDLDKDPDYAELVVENFTGFYQAGECHEIECIEQFYEVAQKEGDLVEANIEFEFSNGTELNFSYDRHSGMHKARLESNSPELARTANDALPEDATLPSRGFSYINRYLGAVTQSKNHAWI